jgi:hypothetical protein
MSLVKCNLIWDLAVFCICLRKGVLFFISVSDSNDKADYMYNQACRNSKDIWADRGRDALSFGTICCYISIGKNEVLGSILSAKK